MSKTRSTMDYNESSWLNTILNKLKQKKKMIILIYEYNIIFSWLIISDLKSQKVFKINFLTKIGNESK